MAKTSIADASTISTRYLHRFDKTENGKSEMRKAPIMLGILSLAFLQTLANANAREQLSADALRAFAQGANIEIDLRVVDSTGKPVEGASVNVGLSRKQSDDFKSYAGRTDTNGNWRVEARCSNLIHVRVTKEGHYETRIDRHLFSFDYADVNRRVKGRRWSPWKQCVVLKEKRKPIPMFIRSTPYQMQLPRGKRVGFDFDAADLVEPYGKGKRTDVFFQFDSETPAGSRYATTNRIQIIAVNEMEGFLSFSKDVQSQLKSCYSSPTNGFAPVLEYRLKRDQENPSTIYENTLPKNRDGQNTEYIVFRIRVEIDNNGNITHSRYGKIYGFRYDDFDLKSEVKTGFVNLLYYLNPNDNDPNLEFDGSTNLSDPSWRNPLGDL